MNITRDQLTDADFETLFTRDPHNLIESIIVSLLWAKGQPNEAELLEKQRYIFEKWLTYYGRSIWDDAIKVSAGREAQANAFRAGQIHALRNLPIKRGLLHRVVDLHEVARMLTNLSVEQNKAVEPKGVKNNAGPDTTTII